MFEKDRIPIEEAKIIIDKGFWFYTMKRIHKYYNVYYLNKNHYLDYYFEHFKQNELKTSFARKTMERIITKLQELDYKYYKKRVLAITKNSKELGWKMQTKFEDGLEKTISWYMENPQIWKNLDSNIFESTPWKVSN
mgnify:CR=1 FL=1